MGLNRTQSTRLVALMDAIKSSLPPNTRAAVELILKTPEGMIAASWVVAAGQVVEPAMNLVLNATIEALQIIEQAEGERDPDKRARLILQGEQAAKDQLDRLDSTVSTSGDPTTKAVH